MKDKELKDLKEIEKLVKYYMEQNRIEDHELDEVFEPYPTPAIGFSLLKGPSASGNFNLPMTASYYMLRQTTAYP